MLLWIGQGISGLGSFMQVWAINWHLYAITHKAISLGLIGLFRVIPIIIFSLIGGSVADAIDRRKVMLSTQTLMASVALIFAYLTWRHELTQLWIYGLTVVGAAAVSFDNPARQALLPQLVPKEDLTNAFSLNTIIFRVSTIGGPVAAGFLIARGGLVLTYLLNAVSFLAVIGALLAMRLPHADPTHQDGEPKAVGSSISLESIKEGLQFVLSTPLLTWTMALDFFATFWSSANALLPIFARDILHVGARGYGFLAAAQEVGALLAGGFLAMQPTIRRQGRAVLWSVMLFGLATVIYGVSRSFLLSWLALAVVGGSDAVSTIMRVTIRNLVTPNRLRGRMISVNMIFFMGGPQLGEFEAGLVAQWLNGPLSVIIGGVGCLLTVGWVAWRASVLRRYVFQPEAAAAPETA